MAQPLTKLKRSGEVYARPPTVEANIDGVLAQDSSAVRRRLEATDRYAPEYLSSECLVHLLRHYSRRDDGARRGGLGTPKAMRSNSENRYSFQHSECRVAARGCAEGAWNAAVAPDEPASTEFQHTRATEYPHEIDPVIVEQVLDRFAVPGSNGSRIVTATGEIVDRKDATIDHRNPSVLEHWNTVGHDSPRSVRNDFFHDPTDMVPLTREDNGRLGRQAQLDGGEMTQVLGPNYTRYVRDEL